jgi:hypothetical protein
MYGHALWHPNGINYNERKKVLALSLDFDWSGKWSIADHPKIAQLRQEYKAPER